MRINCRRTLQLAGLLVSFAVLAAAQEVGGGSPAIQIGSFDVSRYLVGKYYGRFAAGTGQKTHREITTEEAKEWLDLFVAKQVIIADLKAHGYFEKVQVRTAVDTMERHMLTQSEGPLYNHLFPHAVPLEEAVLKKRYDAMKHSMECLVLGFDNDRACQQILGTDFMKVDQEERLRRARATRSVEQVRFFEGPAIWPFGLFTEISDALINANEGEWTKVSDPDFGTYIFLKQKIDRGNGGDFVHDRSDFSRYAAFIDRQLQIRRRRAVLLRTSHLALNPDAVNALAPLLAKLEAPAERLSEEQLDTLTSGVLYTFDLDHKPVEVSSKAFCVELNRQLVRHLPRSSAEIRKAVEDRVVEQLDLVEAYSLKIDQNLQFVEDRKGYTGFTALDYFERHEIQPSISIDASDLEKYYASHSADFVQTTQVKGILVEFDEQEKAANWMQTSAYDGHSFPGAKEVTLTRSHPLPGFEKLERVILECPPGYIVGPVERENKFCCFQKGSNSERGMLSFEEAKPAITVIHLQMATDQRERQLAKTLSAELQPKIYITESDLKSLAIIAGQSGSQ